jgi:hypothetical protein
MWQNVEVRAVLVGGVCDMSGAALANWLCPFFEKVSNSQSRAQSRTPCPGNLQNHAIRGRQR